MQTPQHRETDKQMCIYLHVLRERSEINSPSIFFPVFALLHDNLLELDHVLCRVGRWSRIKHAVLWHCLLLHLISVGCLKACHTCLARNTLALNLLLQDANVTLAKSENPGCIYCHLFHPLTSIITTMNSSVYWLQAVLWAVQRTWIVGVIRFPQKC